MLKRSVLRIFLLKRKASSFYFVYLADYYKGGRIKLHDCLLYGKELTFVDYGEDSVGFVLPGILSYRGQSVL